MKKCGNHPRTARQARMFGDCRVASLCLLAAINAAEVTAGTLRSHTKHVTIGYGGETTTLGASGIGAWGWDVKDGTVTTAASKGVLELIWGKRWYQRMRWEGYSTQSLLPTGIGRGPNEDASLDRIALIWGFPKQYLPSVRFVRTDYRAAGVVTGTLPIQRDGQLLQEGDEIEAGVTYTGYLLVWRMIDQTAEKQYAGFFLDYGIGYGEMTYMGTREEWGGSGPPTMQFAGQEMSGSGITIHMDLNYGGWEISPSSLIYTACRAQVTATGMGGLLKGGYELGLCFEPTEQLTVRSYIGGYFYPITTWGEDFGSIQTSWGRSLGLQLEATW